MASTSTSPAADARARLEVAGTEATYYRLDAVSDRLAALPFTVKVLLENVLRNSARGSATADDVAALAAWRPGSDPDIEIPFMPGRVLLQDFTGVPAVVDLAAMRDAMDELGGDPALVNPLVPASLVIDHSVQIDRFGSADAYAYNVQREYERNGERYQLLRWAQTALRGFRVVPPGTGIVHQVNLEFLGDVVSTRDDEDGETTAFPDTLVGTDSHTTMISGLGILGYGVGGIEAEAVMLGQPLYQPLPTVVGVRLHGALPQGSTATDLVLVISQLLRAHGVVGKFVEYYGDGLASLALADRATLANMAPEYGATTGIFPIDDETLDYLRLTGREERVALVEAYARAQGLWREPGAAPEFDETLELDLGTVVPSVAGPRRPQDRIVLSDLRASFESDFPPPGGNGNGYPEVSLRVDGRESAISTGSVAIAAITSCTNTSNPSVMVGAGLLARKAVEKGLTVRPTVKTSLAPGSRAVTEYLRGANLLPALERLGFDVVGYGCTTCIGNSGPLDEAVNEAIEEHELVVAAVLSGNRNFEGRIHPLVRAAYLASPPLVVAFALAGRVDIDLEAEPLGTGSDGGPVFLADIWPSADEIRATIGDAVTPELFRSTYASVFEGDERWRALPVPEGDRYDWDPSSSYIAAPPFFAGLTPEPEPIRGISGARVLALLGDSVTTDHISPAGVIPAWSPAGQWLQARGVTPAEFNSFGARRGHHEVMMRGTFGNIRLRNALAEQEGPYTTFQPGGEPMFIYDAAMRYAEAGTPLLVLAGAEYGSGSSRDWAAKGTRLLGIRAVLAESFERIHRSNLVGMGVLPLQFRGGQNVDRLRLTGTESYDVLGLDDDLAPRSTVTVVAHGDAGDISFEVDVRLDGAIEVDYYRNGGILPTVLRRLAAGSTGG
ncbi:MAG: aconitate hydratase AcnA [Chloroflexota bacterium]|jgi:aconitate hydratase